MVRISIARWREFEISEGPRHQPRENDITNQTDRLISVGFYHYSITLHFLKISNIS